MNKLELLTHSLKVLTALSDDIQKAISNAQEGTMQESSDLIMGSLLGTALVILMSITAISLPEIMMLKKVLSWKLIGLFLGYLVVAFIIVGYCLNWIM